MAGTACRFPLCSEAGLGQELALIRSSLGPSTGAEEQQNRGAETGWTKRRFWWLGRSESEERGQVGGEVIEAMAGTWGSIGSMWGGAGGSSVGVPSGCVLSTPALQAISVTAGDAAGSPDMRPWGATQWLPAEADFTSQGTHGNVWRRFWWSHLGRLLASSG